MRKGCTTGRRERGDGRRWWPTSGIQPEGSCFGMTFDFYGTSHHNTRTRPIHQPVNVTHANNSLKFPQNSLPPFIYCDFENLKVIVDDIHKSIIIFIFPNP